MGSHQEKFMQEQAAKKAGPKKEKNRWNKENPCCVQQKKMTNDKGPENSE